MLRRYRNEYWISFWAIRVQVQSPRCKMRCNVWMRDMIYFLLFTSPRYPRSWYFVFYHSVPFPLHVYLSYWALCSPMTTPSTVVTMFSVFVSPSTISPLLSRSSNADFLCHGSTIRCHCDVKRDFDLWEDCGSGISSRVKFLVLGPSGFINIQDPEETNSFNP